VFDHERLEVYKLQLEFIGWATKLLEEIEQHGKRRAGRVLGQLDEASVSVLLNVLVVVLVPRPRSGSRGRRTTTRDENECNG
jgi:hypothetical protein